MAAAIAHLRVRLQPRDMSLSVKEDTLGTVEQVPVVCPTCRYSGTLPDHDKALNYALVYNTYLHEVRDELRMLVRVEQLFASFPNSGHYLKVLKTRLDRPAWPHFRDDPDFEKALEAEPDLSEFLKNKCARYVPGRLRKVKELVQKWENELDFTLLTD